MRRIIFGKFRIISILPLVLFAAIGGSAQAADPKPFPNFTFKSVKPPKGTGSRINIQIEPPSDIQVKPPVSGVSASNETPGSYSWFWEAISPLLDQTGPGRLRPALVRLDNPPSGAGVRAPRLQVLQEITAKYGRTILRETIGTKVSPALALAVIAIESGGRADAVSKSGAQGLMQLMPATAQRFGVNDALAVSDNIKGGVAFLDFLMTKFDRDPILVLAGYNAGENSIAKHKGVPPFAETRDYVPKVLAAFKVARGLCITPPQLITDGCVFRRQEGN